MHLDLENSYLAKYASLIKKGLNSIEVTLLIRNAYNSKYFTLDHSDPIEDPLSKEIEDMFGVILKREEESDRLFTTFETAINTYIIHGIGNIYKLSLNEYLDLTPYAKNLMVDIAIEHNKKMQSELSAYNKLQEDSLRTSSTAMMSGIQI